MIIAFVGGWGGGGGGTLYNGSEAQKHELVLWVKRLEYHSKWISLIPQTKPTYYLYFSGGNSQQSTSSLPPTTMCFQCGWLWNPCENLWEYCEKHISGAVNTVQNKAWMLGNQRCAQHQKTLWNWWNWWNRWNRLTVCFTGNTLYCQRKVGPHVTNYVTILIHLTYQRPKKHKQISNSIVYNIIFTFTHFRLQ